MKPTASIILLILFISCTETKSKTADIEAIKKEIGEAERSFATMAKEKGIAEAFSFFADSNAVIKRKNDSLITGKDAIRNFYSADFYKNASVSWAPDFIEASPDGNLGYTYGKYLWQSKDSSGKVNEARGIFHTVWKKQKDGSWRYVWD